MAYTLYYSPDSCNLAVRFVLEALGLDYRERLVDRSLGEQHSDSFRRLNPQGLLPVLLDGDVPMFETAAICLYLADRHGELFPPVSSELRGRGLKWLFFMANTVHAELRVYWYAERFAGAGAAVALRATVAQRIKRSWQLIEHQLARSGDRTIVGTGTPGIVDFYAAHLARTSALYPAGQPAMPGHWRFFPAVRDWLRRLEALPALARSCRKEGIEPPWLVEPRRPPIALEKLAG